MKKRFTIGGAIVGLLYGVCAVGYAFFKAPGSPGIFELIVRAIIIAFSALLGFIVGSIVSVIFRKK